jgi:hypothetical protein
MLTCARALFLATVFFLAGTPCLAQVDLSGTWASTEVNSLVLLQAGSRVTAEQKSPDIEAMMGKNLFEGTLNGQVIKGRVATVLPNEQKEFCGKKWARWTEFELTLSADGNRLEGQWHKYQQSTKVKGCPDSGSSWQPWVLTRTAAPLPVELPATGPSGKDWLMGALAMLALALVSFFIRSAYVNSLVSSYKRSPNTAGLAGWGLFGGLLFGSAIGAVALVSPELVKLPVLAPLVALSLLCLVMCGILSVKK